MGGCLKIPAPGVASIPAFPISGDKSKIEKLRNKYKGIEESEGSKRVKRVKRGQKGQKGQKGSEFDSVLRECKDDPCQRRERNLILEELMLVVDYAYREYEGNLIAGRAKWKFGLGTATQALSLASTASTVEASKTILSGISTLIGSTDTELDKNFYLDQTSYALAHQMNAQRLTVSTRMRKSMRKEYIKYSLERGLIDIEEYYRAGTIATAVQNVYQGASELITKAKQAIDELENPTTQQPNNPTTQQPNNPTTQQPNNPTTQQPNNPTTQQPNNPTPNA